MERLKTNKIMKNNYSFKKYLKEQRVDEFFGTTVSLDGIKTKLKNFIDDLSDKAVESIDEVAQIIASIVKVDTAEVIKDTKKYLKMALEKVDEIDSGYLKQLLKRMEEVINKAFTTKEYAVPLFVSEKTERTYKKLLKESVS